MRHETRLGWLSVGGVRLMLVSLRGQQTSRSVVDPWEPYDHFLRSRAAGPTTATYSGEIADERYDAPVDVPDFALPENVAAAHRRANQLVDMAIVDSVSHLIGQTVEVVAFYGDEPFRIAFNGVLTSFCVEDKWFHAEFVVQPAAVLA